MRDRIDHGSQDSDLSEDDAWWLTHGRKAAHPSDDAPPTPAVDEEIVEPVPMVEDEVAQEPGDDDEIWLVDDEPEPVVTWVSLENTITLRADEARTRIADIANSVRETGRAT